MSRFPDVHVRSNLIY